MAKKSSKKSGKRSKRARATGRAGSRLATPLETLRATLSDPCNGPVLSGYGGESGIVQRFVQDLTYGTTAGHTCGFVILCPAANVHVNATALTPGASVTPAAGGGPGAQFLGTNAAKSRAVAACVSVIPSAVSMTNMTGEIAVANISYNSVEAGTATTVDNVFQLANQRAVLSKRTYDIKWYPALMDSTYAPVNNPAGTTNLTDPADHNAILVAWRGYPAAVGLSIRYTTILEWTPEPTLGMAVSTAPRAPVDHLSLAASLHRYSPTWWHNLMGDVGNHLASEAGKGLKYLTSVGIQSAVRWGSTKVPMLMM